MMPKRGLSIDPGVSNGLCLFEWSETEPFRQVMLRQFSGGAQNLYQYLTMMGLRASKFGPYFNGAPLDALVVEKFTPRQNEGFNLTQDSVEPLRGEGALIGMGMGPFIQWAQPHQQYFMGSSSLPKEEKKKLAREFLETHDLLPTGTKVDSKDADDAISAELHAIAWLRRKRHMPTLLALFGEAS